MRSAASILVTLALAPTGCSDSPAISGGTEAGETGSGAASSGTSDVDTTTTGGEPQESTSTSSGSDSADASSTGSPSHEPPEGGLGPWGFGYVELNTQSYAVAAGDFDGDGHLDLVTRQGTIDDGNLETWGGNGNGDFERIALTPITGREYVLRPGDFSGDGHLDLALFERSGESFRVAVGDSRGGFGAPATASLSGIFDPSVRAMRYDDDASMDLFISAGYGEGAIVARAAPDIGFEVAASVESVACFVSSTAVADFDNDGLDDVVTTGNCADDAEIVPLGVYGRGANGFERTQVVVNADGQVIESADVVLTDANSDGNLDIVTPSPNALLVVPGFGNGLFDASGSLWSHEYGGLGLWEGAVRRIVPLVRPSDETTMFVVSEAESVGMAGLLEQNEPGVLTTTTIELQGRIVGSGDFDGDGRLDVVVLDGSKNADDLFIGDVGIWLSGG